MRIPRIPLAIGAFSILTTGCFVNHRGYVEPDPLSICLIGSCIGWHLAEETREDRRIQPPPPQPQPYYEHDHYHSDSCGCPSRWIQGHRAYWYHGHWEYFDGRNWYVFEGDAPPPTW